ncbi:MAG: hypothetical protein JWM19_6893, partial [Actinomycetia bacterium]|nr:hypothetical protein [Actinomycetes bacterium]
GGIEHDIGRIAPDEDDGRSRAEQCRYLVGGNDLRIVLGHDVEVDIGQLMPGPGAHRAEHRHRAHPAIVLVMRDDLRDESAVRYCQARPSQSCRQGNGDQKMPAHLRREPAAISASLACAWLA